MANEYQLNAVFSPSSNDKIKGANYWHHEQYFERRYFQINAAPHCTFLKLIDTYFNVGWWTLHHTAHFLDWSTHMLLLVGENQPTHRTAINLRSRHCRNEKPLSERNRKAHIRLAMQVFDHTYGSIWIIHINVFLQWRSGVSMYPFAQLQRTGLKSLLWLQWTCK